MALSKESDVLLALICLGIGHIAIGFPDSVDWNQIWTLATKQGVSAIVLDGIEQLPESKRPPQRVLLEWIGDTLQSYECSFERYKKAMAGLSGFYKTKGYKMMILKGYACGLTWPKPEHRPYVDIDIWQFGKQKEADVLLNGEKGIKIDKSHHHHTVFSWNGFTVENHYDFLNVYHHKSNVNLEKILKNLVKMIIIQ